MVLVLLLFKHYIFDVLGFFFCGCCGVWVMLFCFGRRVVVMVPVMVATFAFLKA